MRQRRSDRNGQKGFTLTELLVVIAVIGILAGIALPRLVGYRDEADKVFALDQLRDLQALATVYYHEHEQPPTIEELSAQYNRSHNDKIIGRWAVMSVGYGQSSVKLAEGGVNGYQPAYIICSTYEIRNVAYVYGLDDKPPEVAKVGSDPIGIGQCGPSTGSAPAQPAAPVPTPEPPANPPASPPPTNNPPEQPPGNPSGGNPLSNECNVDEQCPCENNWPNHGQYENCVVHLANECWKAGKISKETRQQWVTDAAHSICGM